MSPAEAINQQRMSPRKLGLNLELESLSQIAAGPNPQQQSLLIYRLIVC